MTAILDWLDQQKQQQQGTKRVQAMAPPTQEAAAPHLVELAHVVQAGNQRHREEQQTMLQELAQLVPPALHQERHEAQQSLREAQSLVQRSATTLAHHEATTPAAGNVPEWARERAELAGQLEAYERLEEQAAGNVHEVEQRYRHALRWAWEGLHAKALQDYQQMVEQDRAALQRVTDEYNRLFADIDAKEKQARQRVERIRAHQP